MLMNSSPPFSYPFPIEFGLVAASEYLESARFSHCVWPREYPVLPRRKSPEDSRFHRLVRTKAQVCFQATERIGRKTGALFKSDADFIVPVKVVRRRRDNPQFQGLPGVQFYSDDRPTPVDCIFF